MKKLAMIIFVFYGLLLTSCATYVKLRPANLYSSASGAYYKNQGNFINRANVFIPEKDLTFEHSAHFGLIGYLFPIKVQVGQTLKTYTEEYLGILFDSVDFNSDKQSKEMLLSFVIKKFDISAFMKSANLELMVTINDKTGNQIFEKIYSAKGDGRFPIYFFTDEHLLQVQNTTTQVFKKVFDELFYDIRQLKLVNNDLNPFTLSYVINENE